MKKAKVILKENSFTDGGLKYTTKDRGDDGICFTMAIGYAMNLAKMNNVPLKTVNAIVKDTYKEMGEVENDKD